MLQELINQDYLIVENNVVSNVVVWNGDTSVWTPPDGSIALIKLTIPAMVWVYDSNIKDYALSEVIGAGDIGFTWDGSLLTTNQPKPTPPKPKGDQPIVTGTTTI